MFLILVYQARCLFCPQRVWFTQLKSHVKEAHRNIHKLFAYSYSVRCSNEVSGSAWFQIEELSGMPRTQPLP